MKKARLSRIAKFWPLALVWLFVCGLVLVTLRPWHPKSLLQWLLLVVLGPLAYVSVEYLGELVFSPKVADRISSRQFSWARIAYGLGALLLLAGLGMAGFWLLAPAFGHGGA